MSIEETPKPKDSEAEEKAKESRTAEEMEAEMETREKGYLVDDRAARQDLTQGMDTGTHDSTHRGVNWPPEFSVHERPKPAADPQEPKDKPDKS